jgi:hypothetical protein
MVGQIVVGLFESRGMALDAFHRLHTEGVPETLTSLVVLHDIALVDDALAPRVEVVSVDQEVLGPEVLINVRRTFAHYVHNGETAVLVQTETAEDIEFAGQVMRLFAPVAIEIMALIPGSPVR